ncbi:PAS domain-containing protein, partial [Planosporangium flavigriseum]
MVGETVGSAGQSGDPLLGGGLLLAENDLRLLADSLPHIMWVSAPDGFTEYVNRWVVEYTGLPEEANLGWGWVALIHPDDAERARNAWDEAARAETAFESEYRIRRADGEFRWHSWRSVPVRGADGRIAKWIGTASDIEDRKALEESLRRSERQTAETLTLLETLQSAAPVGFGFVDRQFRLIRANDWFTDIAGAPVGRLIGRTVAEAVPAIWAQTEHLYRRVLDTGQSVVGTELTVHPKGESDGVCSWLASFYPVRVNGEVIGVGVVVVDLTERKDAEAFRSVVMDEMAEGLYTQDDQGRLMSMNRAAEEMLGWTEEELLGKRMHDIVHFQAADGTPIPASECPMRKARAEGRPIRVDDQVFTRKDGSIFPVSYSSAPLHIGSTVGGVVIVFRDITEQRERQRLELATRHDQQLESLGRLSAG